jgi:hypothetical protein
MIKLAVLVMALAACGGGNAQTTSNTGPTGEPPPSTAAEEWTLVSITNADTSCGIELQGADGQSKYFDGSYDFCPGGPRDAAGLVGKKVTITTEKGNVMAAECEGNPDCGKSEEVDIVESITEVPTPAP